MRLKEHLPLCRVEPWIATVGRRRLAQAKAKKASRIYVNMAFDYSLTFIVLLFRTSFTIVARRSGRVCSSQSAPSLSNPTGRAQFASLFGERTKVLLWLLHFRVPETHSVTSRRLLVANGLRLSWITTTVGFASAASSTIRLAIVTVGSYCLW